MLDAIIALLDVLIKTASLVSSIAIAIKNRPSKPKR